VQDVEKDKVENMTDSGYFHPLATNCENPEPGDGDGQEDGLSEEQGAGAIVLAGPTEQENGGIWNSKASESPKDFEIFPPKSVALHRVRWNTNKGSKRWLCYGGAAGIIRCQRI
jgi:general transcription factor 3C polypeptide 2